MREPVAAATPAVGRTQGPRPAGLVRAREAALTPWLAAGAVLLICAAILLAASSGTTLWIDDWSWALGRRGNDLGTFLRPHNGHLSLIPILIYRAIYASSGISDYTPFRLVLVVAALVLGVLVFVYVHRRVGLLWAALATALVLLLGPAWQDLIWPFQIGWLISLAAGLAALLSLDRGDRRGDRAACVLLGVSLLSSGLALPVALGMAIDLLWARRSWRTLWIVGLPLLGYGAWYLKYHDNNFIAAAHAYGIPDPIRSGVLASPRYAADLAAASAGAAAGLEGQLLADLPTSGRSLLDFGAPLAVALALAAGWRLRRLPQIPGRVLCLAAIPLSFWLLTGITRSFISAPYTSRYLLVGVLAGILLAAELGRGVVVRPEVRVLGAALALMAILGNIGSLRDAGRYLRNSASDTRASVAALDLTRGLVKPDFSTGVLGDIKAGPYFAAERSIGTPAYDEAHLLSAPEHARAVADSEFVRIHGVALAAPSAAATPTGPPPAVEVSSGGTLTRRGSCLDLQAPGFNPGQAQAELHVTLPAAGVGLSISGAPAQLTVRRFSSDVQKLGDFSPPLAGVLRIGPDRARQPWHLNIATMGRVSVCSLG